VGRTQEMLYNLNSLFREGAIPSIPVYVDSPLAIDTTTVFEMHPENFDQSEDLVRKARELFDFPLLHFTRDVEESKAINSAKGPPPGEWRGRSAEHDSHRRISGRAYARASHR
jgi:metallo-beta-lactamase family protein